MPHGHYAGSITVPSKMYDYLRHEVGALEGAPICGDVARVSGGTDSKGFLISDSMAIASYGAKPADQNARLVLGVAEEAIAAGGYERFIFCGPTQVRVNNPVAASLSLAVGDLLCLVPGQDYLRPVLVSDAGGTAQVLSNRVGKPIAMVRKAVVLTASQTALVPVYLWPTEAPRFESLQRNYDAAPGADKTDHLLWVTPGAGMIVAAGHGCLTGGSQGSVELDVKIEANSIFTTKPVLVNDCAEPFHSLVNTDAPGAASGPGTGGSYGTLDAANLFFSPRQYIKFSHNDTGVWNGTGYVVQVDCLLF